MIPAGLHDMIRLQTLHAMAYPNRPEDNERMRRTLDDLLMLLCVAPLGRA